MTTKTITIMEDAYEMLLSNKRTGESFSEQIRRAFSKGRKKHNLMDIFGIISEEDGNAMLKDLEESRNFDLKKEEEMNKEWNF